MSDDVAVTLTHEEARLLRQWAFLSVKKNKRPGGGGDYWLPIAESAYRKLRVATGEIEEDS